MMSRPGDMTYKAWAAHNNSRVYVISSATILGRSETTWEVESDRCPPNVSPGPPTTSRVELHREGELT